MFPVWLLNAASQRHAREQAKAGITDEALVHPEILPPEAQAMLDRHNASEAAVLQELDAVLNESQHLQVRHDVAEEGMAELEADEVRAGALRAGQFPLTRIIAITAGAGGC